MKNFLPALKQYPKWLCCLLVFTALVMHHCQNWVDLPDTPGWDRLTIDSSADVGSHSSLAYGSNGNYYISYYDEDHENLKLATIKGFALDGEGKLIADTDYQVIAILFNLTTYGWHSDLVLNNSNDPFISFHDYEPIRLSQLFGDEACESFPNWLSGNRFLLYNGQNGSIGSWDFNLSIFPEIKEGLGCPDLPNELPLPGGLYPSAVLLDDTGSRIGLCFYQYNLDLSIFFSEDFMPTDGEETQFSIFDYFKGNLTYVYSDDGGQTWQPTGTFPGNDIPALDTEGDNGLFSSLKKDDIIPDLLHISYYNISEGVLKYIKFYADGSIVENVTVDNRTYVGSYTSLDVFNGLPGISYYDEYNDALMYAEFDGNQWIITTVDDGSDYKSYDVGQYTSLDIDYNGEPHISYLDARGNNLKYATRHNGEWIIEQVDSTSLRTGLHSSIVVQGNQVAISYYDYFNGSLRLALKDLSLIHSPESF